MNYVGSLDNGVQSVLGVAGDGDLVLTLGAGNVCQAGDLILAALREKS